MLAPVSHSLFFAYSFAFLGFFSVFSRTLDWLMDMDMDMDTVMFWALNVATTDLYDGHGLWETIVSVLSFFIVFMLSTSDVR